MIWEKSQIFHRITILESGILRSKPKGKEVKIMPFSSLWEDNVLQSTSKNFQHFPTLDICHQFSSVQFSRSVVSDSLPAHESQHARPPCPSPTPGVHSDSCPSSQWCHPAISSFVVPFSSCPPIPLSIRVFSNESTLRMRWPKYWTFSFSIIPSKKVPGLISFRMDWLNLLAVQGTLKSLLQHHSCVQLLRPHGL